MYAQRILIAALIPFTASLAACSGEVRAAEASEKDAATPISVRAANVVTDRAVISASGIIDARASADIAFQVGGKISKVAVEEGQYVSAGQLLARIDSTDYILSFEQSVLNHTRAVSEARRSRALLEVNGIAANDFEKVDNAARQATVSVELAAKRLSDTRLTAPISGIIARRDVEIGETVPSGKPIFTIVDLDVVHIRVSVPEVDIGAITVGHTAAIHVPSLGGDALEGQVRLVGVAADPTTRTYPVEIALRNPTHRLKAGMVAEASITTGSSVNRLTIPANAILRDAEGVTRIFVFSPADQRVHTRRVTIRGVVGSDVEVSSGVNAGELVVIGGWQHVRDGSRAKPVNEQIVINGAAPAPSKS